MYNVGKKGYKKNKYDLNTHPPNPAPSFIMKTEPELIFLLDGHYHFILQAGSEALERAHMSSLSTLQIFFSEVHVARLEHLMVREGRCVGALVTPRRRRSPTGPSSPESEGRIPCCKLCSGCAAPGRRRKACPPPLLNGI